MMAGDHHVGAVKPAHTGDDFLTLRNVCAHDVKFGIVEFSGFEQDGIGNADLAHIVQKTAGDQGLHGVTGQPHVFGDACSNPRHPVIMRASIRVAFGNGAAERFHHRNVRVEHLTCLALIVRRQMNNDRIERAPAKQ